MIPAWISFDCYGTLIDWERGLRQFFSRLCVKKRVFIPPEELLKAWEPIQFRLIHGAYRRYREILYRSLEETLRACKIGYSVEDGRALAQAFGSWRSFPDVPEILPALQKRCRIAIISNTDREFITRSVTHLGIVPDLVVIAADVRAYKPSPKPFQEALARMGIPAHRCLHAAFGVKYDLGPARELGMKTCLVRRSRLPPPVTPAPTLEVPDLRALAGELHIPV